MADKNTTTKRRLIKIGKSSKELITIHDEKGNVLHRMINPLMLEVRSRDIVQMIVGSLILAIPVAFTQEVWDLGALLPWKNVIALSLLSFLSISVFIYYNNYRRHFKEHEREFIKRVLAVYLISLFIVGIFLTVIDQAPWATNWLLALKRTIIVAFPASMSAALVDNIK